MPNCVIEGMLAAIGIIIILKELPHAIGYDKAHEGDWFALENGAGGGYFTEIINAINYAHVGAIAIPKHNGSATKKTTMPDNKSFF